MNWLDWCLYCTESGLHCIGLFSPALPLKFAQSNPPANRKQGPIHEEIYQTLLTIRSRVSMDSVHAANICKPTQTRINRDKYTFCDYKIIGAPKKFKNWPRPLFRPRTDQWPCISSKAKSISWDRPFFKQSLLEYSYPSGKIVGFGSTSSPVQLCFIWQSRTRKKSIL